DGPGELQEAAQREEQDGEHRDQHQWCPVGRAACLVTVRHTAPSVSVGARCTVPEPWPRKRPLPRSSRWPGAVLVVGDTGFEPVTSSVSRKRATAAPIARGCGVRALHCEVETGFEPV